MIEIACWDPTGQYQPNELVEGMNTINQAKNRGVALLPYDVDIPMSAIGPAVMRHWGQGAIYNAGQGERGCPMMIEVAPERPYFSWAMRIMALDPNERPSAQVRLITYPHQRATITAGLTKEMYCAELPEFDHHEGATVYGRSHLNANVGGLLFVNFYCTARNIRVLWTAVSQHRNP